jgi:hypothetical protein
MSRRVRGKCFNTPARGCNGLMPFEEIARRLSVNIKTVRRDLELGLLKLRDNPDVRELARMADRFNGGFHVGDRRARNEMECDHAAQDRG